MLGVALYDTGKKKEGLQTLENALRLRPYDRNLLTALAAYAREAGNEAAEKGVLGKLVAGRAVAILLPCAPFQAQGYEAQ